MDTEFYAVAQMRLVDFTLMLREHKINVHVLRHSNGDTLLHRAMQHPELGKTRLLLARQVDVNVRNERNQTPLHSVMYDLPLDWSFEKKMICADLLLMRGAEVNAQDEGGQTPLHYLKKKEGELERYGGGDPGPDWFADAERLLLEWGADPAIRDNNGKTPDQIAADIVNAPWVPPW